MTRKRKALAAIGALALAIAAVPDPGLLPEAGGSRAWEDAKGRLLRLTLSADEKYRLWVPLGEISPHLVDATLLQEDRWFRAHPGVNPVALGRAFRETYLSKSRRVGGSTITMQLARIRFGLDTRTPRGKAVQILRALQLERHYSKDEILEAYLNLAPYGANVEGAGAASFVWLGKPARDVTLAEALTLAVIPQNPVKRSPLAKGGALEAARAALAARHGGGADLDTVRFRGPKDLPFRAPHFVDAQIARGADAATVRTTLDLDLQASLERQIRAYVERERAVGVSNAAALLVDWRTMEVKAHAGSADWFGDEIDGQVDGANSLRSPGSALKPFVYALAFEQGLAHPRTMLKDSPTAFGAFDPENADGEFAGPISAHDALIRSRNVPAVDLASRIEPGLWDLLRDAGVPLRHEEHYGLAIALGGAEVTMSDLVRLYAMLPNGGRLHDLRTRASDPPRAEGKKLLSAESSLLVLDVLAGNPRPEAALERAWVRSPLDVAWKTGTSHGYRDAWAVGVVGPYVLAVWVGNFDGEGNPAFVGVKAAGPLFFRMVDALASRPETRVASFRPHAPNVSRVRVCQVSGQLPNGSCPRTTPSWFLPGVSPIATCEVHRAVAVKNGKRSCDGTGTIEVHEFWPSDLLALFRQAGIPRRSPPPEDPRCPLADLSARGLSPAIVSPRRGVTYTVRSRENDGSNGASNGASNGSWNGSSIELSAVADADVRELYWFLDGRLLGVAKSGETFSFRPRAAGSWTVRAVDDHGRADSRPLVVQRID